MAVINYIPFSGSVPDTLAADFPCVKCLNGDQEKWLAIVYLLFRLRYGANATFNVNTVAAACSCFNCISEDELLDNVVTLLADQATNNDVIPDLNVVEDAACLKCEDELTLKRQALCLFRLWLIAVRPVL